MSARKPFSVRTKTAAQALCSLPDVLPVDSTQITTFDFFICAAGFEERALAVPSEFQRLGARINTKLLLATYRTNPDDNSARKRHLLPILNDISAEGIAEFDADSPAATHQCISSALNGCQNDGFISVAFDISAASSTLIFSVMGSLARCIKAIRLQIFYAPAEVYHEPGAQSTESPPTNLKPENLREVGVSEVDVNELYPGIAHDNFTTYGIAFPSMFPERMKRCLNHLGLGSIGEVEKNIYWILPSTNSPAHQWRLPHVENVAKRLANGHPSDQVLACNALPDDCLAACDVFDYKACASMVIDRISARPACNISLVHMGTKLQAVGAALALAARQEVSLINARPVSFAAASYSRGWQSIYTINFDDFHGAIENLASVGSVEIVSGHAL